MLNGEELKKVAETELEKETNNKNVFLVKEKINLIKKTEKSIKRKRKALLKMKEALDNFCKDPSKFKEEADSIYLSYFGHNGINENSF